MEISKELAIKILKYLDRHKDFYFPFSVVCKERIAGDGELVEIESMEWQMITGDEKYQTFELWENLQNLYEDTVELMAKGFLEKITGKSVEHEISKLIKKYRSEWKEKLWESENIEKFGYNEFVGGKTEGCEECLEIIEKFKK